MNHCQNEMKARKFPDRAKDLFSKSEAVARARFAHCFV